MSGADNLDFSDTVEMSRADNLNFEAQYDLKR